MKLPAMVIGTLFIAATIHPGFAQVMGGPAAIGPSKDTINPSKPAATSVDGKGVNPSKKDKRASTSAGQPKRSAKPPKSSAKEQNAASQSAGPANTGDKRAPKAGDVNSANPSQKSNP